MDLIARVAKHFEDSAQTQLNAVEMMAAPIAAAIETMTNCLINGGKILACGNGGSASDSQRFASKLIGRFEAERQELAAIALTTDCSILTSVANDYALSQIFARQVRGLGHAGDVLLAISAAGNAGNVIEAINAAHEHDMHVVALTGKDGEPGLNGKDGTVIKAMTIVDGDLIVDFEDGGTLNAGRVTGRDGKDAPPVEVELLDEAEPRLTAEDLGRLRVRRVRIGGCELQVLSIATE